jgi:hypothetical protein
LHRLHDCGRSLRLFGMSSSSCPACRPLPTGTIHFTSAMSSNTILPDFLGGGSPLFAVRMFCGSCSWWRFTFLGCLSNLGAYSPFAYDSHSLRIPKNPDRDLTIQRLQTRENYFTTTWHVIFRGTRSPHTFPPAMTRQRLLCGVLRSGYTERLTNKLSILHCGLQPSVRGCHVEEATRK